MVDDFDCVGVVYVGEVCVYVEVGVVYWCFYVVDCCLVFGGDGGWDCWISGYVGFVSVLDWVCFYCGLCFVDSLVCIVEC